MIPDVLAALWDAYLGAPQLDCPIKRRGNKQVGEVQWPRSCVAVDPCDGAMVALKHLANARLAVEHTHEDGNEAKPSDRFNWARQI